MFSVIVMLLVFILFSFMVGFCLGLRAGFIKTARESDNIFRSENFIETQFQKYVQ